MGTARVVQRLAIQFLSLILTLSLGIGQAVPAYCLAPSSITRSKEDARRAEALESFLHAMAQAESNEDPSYRRLLALDRVGRNLGVLLNKKNIMAWPTNQTKKEWEVLQFSKKGVKVIGYLSQASPDTQANLLRYSFREATTTRQFDAASLGNILGDYYAVEARNYVALSALVFMGPHAQPAMESLLRWLIDIRMRIATEKEEIFHFPSALASRAMSALVRIGKPAVQALADRLKRAPRGTLYIQTMVMAETLVALKPHSKAAVDVLLWHMQGPDAKPYEQFWFARRITAIDPSAEQVIPVLVAALAETSNAGATPERASESLILIGKPAIPFLKNVLPNPLQSYHAAVALAHLDPSFPDTVDILASRLDDDELFAGALPVEALGKLGHAAVPALVKALGDGRKTRSAAQALGLIGSAAVDALPTLIHMLDSDNDIHRSVAADAIVHIHPEGALALLDENVPEGQAHEITMAFARAEAYAIPTLLDALKNPSVWIRKNAAEAITLMRTPSPEEAKRLPLFDFHGNALGFATVQMLFKTIEAARSQGLKAAQFAKDHREEARHQVIIKADNSPVTPNDKKIQRTIFAALMPQFPEHYFSGEEDLSGDAFLQPWLAANPKNLQLGSGVWIFVDPIDGTSVYARAIPENAWYGDYAVSILILYNGWPLYALVAAPEMDGKFQWIQANGLNTTVLANGQPVDLHAQPPEKTPSPASVVAPGWVGQGLEHPLAKMLREKKWKFQDRVGSIAVTAARLALGQHTLAAIHFGGLDDALIPAAIGDTMGLEALRPGGDPVFPVKVGDIGALDKSFPVLVGPGNETLRELARNYPKAVVEPAGPEPAAIADKDRRKTDAMRLLKAAIERLEEGEIDTREKNIIRIMHSGAMAVKVLCENRNALINILDNDTIEVLRISTDHVESIGTLSQKAVKELSWQDAFTPYLLDKDERTRWSLDELIENLNSKNLILRMMALQAIELMGPNAARAAPHLIAMVPVDEATLQALIEKALKKMGVHAVPALIQARHHRDPYLRAFALDQLGDLAALAHAWPDAQAVFQEITAALQDPHPLFKGSGNTVRDAAFIILRRIGKPAVPALQNAMQDSRRPAYVRQMAALLWAHADIEADEPRRFLAHAIADKTLDNDLMDIAALYFPGTISRTGMDETTLHDFALSGKTLAPILIAGMEDFIVSEHEGVKHANYQPAPGEYVEALAMIGPPAVPYLINALSDGKKRTMAARTLGRIGPAAHAAVAKLLNCLEINDGFEPHLFRQEVVIALSKINPNAMASLVDKLIALLDDSQPDTRRRAAATLGLIGTAAAKALAKLQELLSDPDEEVHAAALHALDEIRPPPHPSPTGRLTAAQAVEQAL